MCLWFYLHGQGCKLLCIYYDFEHIVLFQILNSVYGFGLFHIHTLVCLGILIAYLELP